MIKATPKRKRDGRGAAGDSMGLYGIASKAGTSSDSGLFMEDIPYERHDPQEDTHPLDEIAWFRASAVWPESRRAAKRSGPQVDVPMEPPRRSRRGSEEYASAHGGRRSSQGASPARFGSALEIQGFPISVTFESSTGELMDQSGDVHDDAKKVQLPDSVVQKKRVNVPWTPAEEGMLKKLRDEGRSWSEIAKVFPMRTEGSLKKHWYKDMHYAKFAEDEVRIPPHYVKEMFLRADLMIDGSLVTSDPGLREQQVEGYRAEGWQTC